MIDLLKVTGSIINVLADLVTLILGVIALWTVTFHRDEISRVFRVLLTLHLAEKVKRIRETLGKLESLSYDTKEDRQEIAAILGELAGQLKPLCEKQAELKEVHIEIHDFIAKRVRLSEADKRRVVHLIHGGLDSLLFESNRELAQHTSK